MKKQRNIGLLILCLLTACQDNEDIRKEQSYIQKINSRAPGKIEPIPKIEKTETFVFPQIITRDPFVSFKTQNDGKRNDKDDLLKSHKKELLEHYPLDALKMVGTLEQSGRLWALIATPEGNVIKVGVGNYLGENFGQIQSISNSGIQLSEKFSEGDGWQHKITTLNLMEPEDKTTKNK